MRRFFQAIALTLLGACAASNAAKTPAPDPASGAPNEALPKPLTVGSRVGEFEKAKVYDAHGAASACEVPRDDCPSIAPDRDFLDHCKLSGFQVRRCGCVDRCAGDVSKIELHFDAAGGSKVCAPPEDGCTPPRASASFQDGCTEHLHRLDMCGCEWLCSGDPTK